MKSDSLFTVSIKETNLGFQNTIQNVLYTG